MSINEIIMYIMVLFMIIGGIDKCIGNKLGLGEQFEEGIMAMGSLALSMVGIITLAPVLANLLSPIVVPVYELLGADPAMFATTLLANDMGGFALAQQLANDPQAGLFAGGNLRCNDGANVSLYNSSSAWHYPKRRPTILSNGCFERDYYNSFWFISRWFNSWHAIVIDYS